MRKNIKIIVVISSLFFLLMVGLIIYPILYKGTIANYTRDYVAEQGYAVQSIKNIDVLHSYSALVLGYNEWRIRVEFEKRPNMFFWFSYKEGKIIYEGVSAEPMLDKEDVIKYSDMFKNGSLLN